jgi:hypothetical protein
VAYDSEHVVEADIAFRQSSCAQQTPNPIDRGFLGVRPSFSDDIVVKAKSDISNGAINRSPLHGFRYVHLKVIFCDSIIGAAAEDHIHLLKRHANLNLVEVLVTPARRGITTSATIIGPMKTAKKQAAITI